MFFDTTFFCVTLAILEPYVDQAGVQLRSACLCLSNAGVKGVHLTFFPVFSLNYNTSVDFLKNIKLLLGGSGPHL